MAGSLVVIETDGQENEKPVTAIKNQWQVQFARFFPYPSLPASTCTSLVPLPNNSRFRAPRGNWIATSSPAASLHIINDHSSSETIIAVLLSGKILEEHYISKLHFSWPQVQCIPEFPPRGSRAVFVSYKDSADEIQKFALRFSTLYEAESFMNAVKENLKGEVEIEPLNTDFGSEFSTQSEFISSNRFPSRTCQDLSDMTPRDSYTQQMAPSLSYEIENQSLDQDAMLKHNSDMTAADSYTPQMTPSLSYDIENQSFDQDAMLKHNSDMTAADSYIPQMAPSLSYEIENQSFDQDAMLKHNSEGIFPALPPSFTSLLANCGFTAEQAANQPKVSVETDLKSQIVRYMEDSAFQDLLSKVQKIISEVGGADMLL